MNLTNLLDSLKVFSHSLVHDNPLEIEYSRGEALHLRCVVRLPPRRSPGRLLTPVVPCSHSLNEADHEASSTIQTVEEGAPPSRRPRAQWVRGAVTRDSATRPDLTGAGSGVQRTTWKTCSFWPRSRTPPSSRWAPPRAAYRHYSSPTPGWPVVGRLRSRLTRCACVAWQSEALRDALIEIDWSNPTASVCLSPDPPHFAIGVESSNGFAYEVKFPKDAPVFSEYLCSTTQNNGYNLSQLRQCLKALALSAGPAGSTSIRMNASDMLSLNHIINADGSPMAFVEFILLPGTTGGDIGVGGGLD